MKQIIFPQKLKKGDHIAIISPAGAVEENQLKEGLQIVREKGYKPVLGKNVYTQFSNGYNYAGTEKERIQDLNWALNDENISAIWASRGGYGCQHLLQKINLSGFKKNPKWYIGYSDNTVIQSYLLKNGYASLHAQTIKTSSFGVSKDSYEKTFNILEGKNPKYSLENHQYNKEGKTDGILVGGNLALIYALLGTPYSFNFKEKIVFIEEIGENFYALDRMMMSLDLAGVFKKAKGIIIGGMTNMGKENDNKNYEESYDQFAYKIIAERLKKYNIPTVFGFPNGHIFHNLPLIIGGHIKMKVGEEVDVSF